MDNRNILRRKGAKEAVDASGHTNLSALQSLLNDDQIQSLETYFSNLIGGAAKNITVSKLSRALNISPQAASRVLTKCKEIGIVNVFYTIRCPECGMLIKKVNSIADIPSESFECYGCNEEIEVKPSDIELVYELEDDSVFTEGQQEDL
jgi:hypothetical protein